MLLVCWYYSVVGRNSEFMGSFEFMCEIHDQGGFSLTGKRRKQTETRLSWCNKISLPNEDKDIHRKFLYL